MRIINLIIMWFESKNEMVHVLLVVVERGSAEIDRGCQ